MRDLKSYLSAVRSQVEDRLARYLSENTSHPRLQDAMRYSVMAGGKRLRPVLCMATAEAVGTDPQVVLPLSCALECIHTYSLIHDDLPAMDDDALRRGKPTCHVQFDEATAILAGDALLTLAFGILAAEGVRAVDADQRGRWLMAISKVASAAGCEGMVAGQMHDMTAEGTRLSLAELENLHCLKTGKMIEVSVGAAALVCNATQDEQDCLLLYGQNLGLAFQVVDDILNVTGDPEKLGKSTGTDAVRGKNTYPTLLGLIGARQYAADLVNKALKALDGFGTQADRLRAIARYVTDRDR
ncbi:polyprenyl synthetase family protein [Desulfosarcina sp. OttesenSCG-928-G10]|nr:polyprenyl synthetase family protein [Desulfosarcina sp. OttesenSCG-928-G10]MDL2322053.1 polyprenyl synthetase family protein [Desulfosarcina sp. OttesenSCG-928-B08]